ncbi:MAG: HEAT repeat domain-containing protein, partial [Myxococcales bacterium]|nr:HEAT repeat domain-containing protein [Myxococcales bacterium]
DADFRDAFDLEIVRDAVDDARTAQIPYDEALAAFLGRFDGAGDPSFAAARDLAAWLRTHPEGAAQLAAALRSGDIDDEARPALFLGLELSGTDAAREVLAEALVDPELDAVDRARAASALSDIGAPTQGTAELLLARAQGDEDAVVANVSVLGLGKMAKRSADDELRGYVRDALDRELAAAGDEVRTRVIIDAIGNTGDAAFADKLSAHLEAESPATRRHAAEALGRLDPGEAAPRLLERLREETDPGVRASIVGAYNGPPTADAIALMSDRLAASTSASERAALITWLGSASRTEPAAQGELVAHLHRETDARLMQQIGSYVPAAALR